MITYADFCAGIGGFRLGIEKSLDWKCIYSCDINKNCEKTYYDNFDEYYSYYDIFDINEMKLDYFDMLCAGFPCQPFSQAGKKSGFNDVRSKVFFKLISIIKQVKPKIIFFENVPYILKHNNGKTISTIKNIITDLGYNLFIETLNSANFNIPQNRNRVYMIAFEKKLGIVNFEPTKQLVKNSPSFRHFIHHLDYSIPISKRWQEYIDLYTGKKTLQQMSFQVPKTRINLERISNDVDLEDCVFQIRSSGIRAISIDSPFPTFAVSNSGGGAMIPVLSKERRHLNLIEIKRIMGYPDDFIFTVNRTDAIKQLANTVCPPVIESLAKDIQKTIKTF